MIHTIRNDLVVVANDIHNPAADRRIKDKWHKQDIIKQGMILRFNITDQTENRRKRLLKLLTSEQLFDRITEHLVEISCDACDTLNRISFGITYAKDSITGDCHYSNDKEGELCKLLWEDCVTIPRTSDEIIKEVIDEVSSFYILRKLMDLGKVTRMDLEEAKSA